MKDVTEHSTVRIWQTYLMSAHKSIQHEGLVSYFKNKLQNTWNQNVRFTSRLKLFGFFFTSLWASNIINEMCLWSDCVNNSEIIPTVKDADSVWCVFSVRRVDCRCWCLSVSVVEPTGSCVENGRGPQRFRPTGSTGACCISHCVSHNTFICSVWHYKTNNQVFGLLCRPFILSSRC